MPRSWSKRTVHQAQLAIRSKSDVFSFPDDILGLFSGEHREKIEKCWRSVCVEGVGGHCFLSLSLNFQWSWVGSAAVQESPRNLWR